MSGKATGWALEQEVKGTTKLVLIALADECRRDGTTCFINRKSIAEVAGLSVKNPHLRKLEEMGLVRCEERTRANGGRTSNLYKLAIDGPFQAAGPVQETSSTPLEENFKGPLKPGLQGPPCSSPQGHVVEPSQKEPGSEPKPPSPPIENRPAVQEATALGFDEWLADHLVVTGSSPPGKQTAAYAGHAATFAGLRREGHSLEDLKLATRGAYADQHRRDNGYFEVENVLRKTKIVALINRGRRQGKVAELHPSTETVLWDGPLEQRPGPKTPTDPEKAWTLIGDEMVHQGMSELTREQWIDTCSATEIDDEFRIVVESQNAEWLKRRGYMVLIKDAAQWMGLAGVVLRYSARERTAA